MGTSGVHRLALGLLRRHVRNGSDDGPLLGVGPLLQTYGARTVFVVIAGGALGSALFFVGVVMRYRTSVALAESM